MAGMESTGVYWRPVWHVLSACGLDLVLANAMHVKNLPGRKTDVGDAAWLADLLAHGLIRGSFVPPPEVGALRELLRTRKQIVRERTSHVQRIQKTLEDANIKLDSVISDIVGMSGRAMLEAMIAGESDPATLAQLASPRIKASQSMLRSALDGRVNARHRFLLGVHLRMIDGFDAETARIDAEVEACLAPFRRAVEQLVTIPGIKALTAETIVSEIGIDMSRFPSAGHLVSWAGLAPGNDESAGKHRSRRMRPGGTWLKTALVQAAWSAVRKKDGVLQARFNTLKAKRGPKRAISAIAAEMLRAIWHMLRDGTFYDPHVPRPARPKTADAKISYHLTCLTKLGYTAQTSQPTAQAA